MKHQFQRSWFFWLLLIFVSCTNGKQKKVPDDKSEQQKGTYAYDAAFLRKHTNGVIELAGPDSSSKVLLSAAYQGRVMTSTASGDTGSSFGWLNYGLISSGEKKTQFNPVGGEERFWLGPEGGQYAIYFKRGDSFSFQSWQVPPIIDTVTYDVRSATKTEAVFTTQAEITNYAGTVFNIGIRRRVALLDKAGIAAQLQIQLPNEVHAVGYQTENRLENRGDNDWTMTNGLLSVWLLGMFTPTPQTIVILPFVPAPNARTFITDNYFGPIPSTRLQVRDSVLFFTCDGRYRSKIGLSPAIARPLAASFDFQHNVLTLVVPEVHKNVPYVNSKWEIQKHPYNGDVINAYNDGPLQDGSQMGPFYEIESSSPALALKKGQAATYTQVTVHLQGDFGLMNQLAKQIVGVDLDMIRK